MWPVVAVVVVAVILPAKTFAQRDLGCASRTAAPVPFGRGDDGTPVESIARAHGDLGFPTIPAKFGEIFGEKYLIWPCLVLSEFAFQNVAPKKN